MKKKITFWILGLIFFIFFIVFITYLLEIYLRSTKYAQLINMYFYKTVNTVNLYVNDEIAGHDLSKNFKASLAFPNNISEVGESKWKVFTNQYGCYDKNKDIKNQDFGILIGDSQTQGIEKYENTWGYSLENKINLKILKCGVSGYGAIQSLIKLEKLLDEIAHEPRFIIYGYSSNDLVDDITFPNIAINNGIMLENKMINLKDGTAVNKDINISKNNLEVAHNKCTDFELLNKLVCLFLNKTVIGIRLMQEILYRFNINLFKKFDERENTNIQNKIIIEIEKNNNKILKNKNQLITFLPYYSFKDYIWLEKEFYNHLNNILKIKDKADEIGSKFYVLYIPEKFEIYPHLINTYWAYKSLDQLNIDNRKKISFDFFKQNEVVYIDPSEKMINQRSNESNLNFYSKESMYWAYDGHIRRKGNDVIAEIIYENLKDIN